MTNHNILLVDDEVNVLKSLRRLLIDTDHKIFSAGSGEEGLQICDREEVALVISDYRMPSMNGVQFLTKVRDQHPHTIRMILSGYADVAAIVEAINDGQVYKFLSKPWNEQELLTTIQRALEHYDLQQENAALLDELRTANAELRRLTENLERQVDDRTRDLAQKNRALETAQRLLSLLPAGVIGIDNEGTVVYMNQAMRNYLGASPLTLGASLSDGLEPGQLRLVAEALDHQRTTCQVEDVIGGVRVICTPLPDQAGVVAIFSALAHENSQPHQAPATPKVESTHVE